MADSLEKQIKKLEGKLKKISKIEIPRAGSSAINKTLAKAKTRVIRGVSKSLKLPQKPIRKRVFVGRSSVKTQKGRLAHYRSAVPVVSLLTPGQIAKAPPRGTNRKGVKAAGRQFDGAFVNRVKNGFQVMQRKGQARYPITVLKIPIQKVVDDVTPKVVARVAKSEMPRIYKQDLKFRLQKYAVNS